MIKEKLIDYLTTNISEDAITNNMFYLVVPFTYFNGDFIGLIITILDNNEFLLSDDGDTFSEISLHGKELSSQDMSKIKNKYPDIEIVDYDQIITYANENNLCSKILDFVEILQHIEKSM